MVTHGSEVKVSRKFANLLGKHTKQFFSLVFIIRVFFIFFPVVDLLYFKAMLHIQFH